MNAEPTVIILPTDAELTRQAAADVLAELSQAQGSEGVAHVVLTGGTLGIQILSDILSLVESGESAVDWARVHVWFGDERFVPAADGDRNALQAREALLDHIDLPAANIHETPASDAVSTPEESALAYAEELARFAAPDSDLPVFDVLLLGMGPDGHIASLFPGTGLIDVEGITTGVRNSPKPPPERVSMTRSTITSARNVWMLVGGESKAEKAAAAIAGAPADEVPAAAAHGTESTRWYLDEAAASQLPTEG